MQQAVEDRCGNDGVPEDLPPLAEALVGGQHDGTPLVPARDELEEEVRAVLVNRDVPDLVDDQQLGQTIVRGLRRGGEIE
jgi:hypothetical protein